MRLLVGLLRDRLLENGCGRRSRCMCWDRDGYGRWRLFLNGLRELILIKR